MGEGLASLSFSAQAIRVTRPINLERLQTQLPQQLDWGNSRISVLTRHATLLRCRSYRIDPPRWFWEQVA